MKTNPRILTDAELALSLAAQNAEAAGFKHLAGAFRAILRGQMAARYPNPREAAEGRHEARTGSQRAFYGFVTLPAEPALDAVEPPAVSLTLVQGKIKAKYFKTLEDNP